MQKITTQINKKIELPNKLQVERCRAAPHLGPKILFFSGGNALKELSKKLKDHTHNSIHIVTPFDSGGSSAKLRKSFNIPALGDIRNRLMALADQSITGNPEIYSLFAHRLPLHLPRQELLQELEQMVNGNHELVYNIPEPTCKIVIRYLDFFLQNMPSEFDPSGASIGNLILTGGYLEHEFQIDTVIYIFSKLVEARGTVRPVVNRDLHLITELENGETLWGQHLLTGKQTSAIQSKVKNIYLSKEIPKPEEVETSEKLRSLISQADLICYPMGSFFSSLIANLLPKGVGSTVARTKSPKIFIPNTYYDPECYGLSVNEQVQTLLQYLQKDLSNTGKNKNLINYILLDQNLNRYNGAIDFDMLQELNIEILQHELVTPNSEPGIDPERIQEILLSLA